MNNKEDSSTNSYASQERHGITSDYVAPWWTRCFGTGNFIETGGKTFEEINEEWEEEKLKAKSKAAQKTKLKKKLF